LERAGESRGLSLGLHELDVGRVVGEGFEVFARMDVRINKALFGRLAKEIHRALFIAENGGDPPANTSGLHSGGVI